MPSTVKGKKRISILITLIVAGEAIFFLPFVVARIFRPTLLSVFEITNTELGAYFSIYGIVAMLSYAFGGTLADRYSARNLMAIALWLTSLGGFIMTWIPGSKIMTMLYGFWGFTTIFLFWAALIRATREWGGPGFQGRAFGWLEGGRGGIAALVGTVAVFLFSWFSADPTNQLLPDAGIHPFQVVILIVSGFTFVSGILVWIFVPKKTIALSINKNKLITASRIRRVISIPSIWMLAIMIVCAYAGYKITDDFSLYAREVLGFSEVGAAAIGTTALWLRAFVAILAGYLADRLNRVNVIIVCYALTIGSASLIGFGILNQIAGLLLLNLTLTAIGIYGVRTLYFAILKEAKVPLGYTGTAVGIVSFVGFTPEIFMGPLMGHLLDTNPGATGHQYVFLVLSLFAFIGLVTSIFFRLNENKEKI